ncbi:uncharacterized protein BDZ99DRAFT_496962 [Mytilinidion resinicola]|uniref:Uncharacterized protein n=1 Tax=Mytilinidion resinicola TaxID=574789 RepID=A0A6A6YUG4_9PEZI|nr:uncharacterized protein BDZ99DRAFT_496962 [Mytilinidion resinicola]KAF2812572.1 hypothetical protein BDZ99DRAFT_496962 [Mytilinidion resinicola]
MSLDPRDCTIHSPCQPRENSHLKHESFALVSDAMRVSASPRELALPCPALPCPLHSTLTLQPPSSQPPTTPAYASSNPRAHILGPAIPQHTYICTPPEYPQTPPVCSIHVHASAAIPSPPSALHPQKMLPLLPRYLRRPQQSEPTSHEAPALALRCCCCCNANNVCNLPAHPRPRAPILFPCPSLTPLAAHPASSIP